MDPYGSQLTANCEIILASVTVLFQNYQDEGGAPLPTL